MKETILKLNRWLFKWYYKRVPEHFRQYTLLKSVSLLIQNYEHKNKDLATQERLVGEIMQTIDKQSKRINNLEMRLNGLDDVMIMRINKAFGTEFPTSLDN